MPGYENRKYVNVIVMSVFLKILRSIRKNGFARTMRAINSRFVSFVTDYSFDVRYGTKTARWVELKDMVVSGHNKSHGVKYQPTRPSALRKVLTAIDAPTQSEFVDLGCGKRRTLLIASEYGFRKVIGVEFSGSLCENAKQNVQKYLLRKNAAIQYEIINADVVDYEISQNTGVIYLFNPFDGIIMDRVLRNIEASLVCCPRKLQIIYHNPVQHQIFAKSDKLGLEGEYEYSGCKFNVYTNTC